MTEGDYIRVFEELGDIRSKRDTLFILTFNVFSFILVFPVLLFIIPFLFNSLVYISKASALATIELKEPNLRKLKISLESEY